jgi:hypothetical protein
MLCLAQSSQRERKCRSPRHAWCKRHAIAKFAVARYLSIRYAPATRREQGYLCPWSRTRRTRRECTAGCPARGYRRLVRGVSLGQNCPPSADICPSRESLRCWVHHLSKALGLDVMLAQQFKERATMLAGDHCRLGDVAVAGAQYGLEIVSLEIADHAGLGPLK